MVVAIVLGLYGSQADVYVPVEFPNGYEATYPEYTWNTDALMQTTVWLKQPLKGFRIGQALLDNFISMADKVDDVLELFCFDELHIDYGLRCYVGDGKLLNLRIVENELSYSTSAVGWRYKAVII